SRRVVVAPLFQPDEPEHLARQLPRAGIVAAGALRRCHRAVLDHGEIRERADDLVGADHAGARDAERGQACDLLLAEEHPARGRRDRAGEHGETGALSCSVRPDQAEDLALLQREADVVVRPQAAEPLAEPLGAQDRRHLASRCSTGAGPAPVAGAADSSAAMPVTPRSGRARRRTRTYSPVSPSGSKRITKIKRSPYSPR